MATATQLSQADLETAKKDMAVAFVSEGSEETGGADPISEKLGTRADQLEMQRLGKKQQFKRNFRFLSILGFTCTLMATWESMLAVNSYALINGGFSGFIYIYIASFVGFFAVVLTMAEMASMAPTTGGQYHWVSEFSPPNMQKFLSYIVGWVCVLGWQTGTASTAFIGGTLVQGLLTLNDPSYVAQRWHGTLIVIFISFVAVLFNTVLAKRLPLIEGIILVLHICGFFAIIIVLWCMAPRTSSHEVWGTFRNEGGWDTMGLAVLVGMLSPIYGFVGPDSANHMSEEIRDASVVVPRCMMWTAILNGALGFIMVVTYCYCAGGYATILGTATGYPFVETFYIATQSKAGATIMTCIIALMEICSSISILATASRQLFAFARDNGLPYPNIFAYILPGWDIPINAIMVSFMVSVLLSLINIGSTAAFNAVASLCCCALFTSYWFSISCIVWRRLTGAYLPPARWSLGKWGLPLNIFSVLWLTFATIFLFFPTYKNPTAESMNWAIVIFSGVIGIALILYWFRGRHVYQGPVVLVKRE
ncbi:MAG: hypothetical protein M1834_001606 [Cirrosporium novae-zelandiae]|nr:MAG: hypothetical protein M1834_004123 [Cirrosporium novae-zelandiae]KAI9735590.1 MAG: hypothetical protein M1834_001606 [Cirrosporium novae-zelandiae]